MLNIDAVGLEQRCCLRELEYQKLRNNITLAHSLKGLDTLFMSSK